MQFLRKNYFPVSNAGLQYPPVSHSRSVLDADRDYLHICPGPLVSFVSEVPDSARSPGLPAGGNPSDRAGVLLSSLQRHDGHRGHRGTLCCSDQEIQG